jgi:uncharacterized protein YndB with AHSA1/START domain
MAKEQLSPDTMTLTVRRTFQAPRERVFGAWTDAKTLAEWFHPSAEYTTKVPELEFKVGGRYKVEMHHQSGNVHAVGGTYREIKPPEKLVFTWRWERDPASQESLVTIEFLDRGASTEVLLTHAQLPDAEQREKHAHGWNGCLEQLARFIQTQ